MYIETPESTTNSLSSGFVEDGAGRHQTAEGDKYVALSFAYSLRIPFPISHASLPRRRAYLVQGPGELVAGQLHLPLVDVSLLYNCIFRRTASQAGGRLPSPPHRLLVCGWHAARVCKALWSWVVCGTRVRSLVCQTTLTVTNRVKGAGSRKCLRLLERHASHLHAMGATSLVSKNVETN